MKNLLLITCLFVSSLIFSQESASTEAGVLNFETEVIDYGTIQQNTNGTRTFSFKNTGKTPIVITNTKGSCGCTVPSKPKGPILPGQVGEINVKYDTNRIGAFTKTITVTSNATENHKVLKIKGVVLKSAKKESDRIVSN